MIRGEVRLFVFFSHVSIHYPLHATWHLHPAIIHDGVQFNCPAMHGGRAKRASFKKNSNPGQIQNMFQIWAKNKKKIPNMMVDAAVPGCAQSVCLGPV
jgi:hypothetical protein